MAAAAAAAAAPAEVTRDSEPNAAAPAAATAAAEGGGEVHGRDPRLAPPWIAENVELLADMAARSSAVPDPTTASSSDSISPIVNLAQLEAAIDRGASSGRLVCLKYYAPWCASCLAVAKPLYEQAAGGGLYSDAVDFYEIDGGCARELVALADVRSYPVAQVYARGALVRTYPIHSAALFDELAAELADLKLKN